MEPTFARGTVFLQEWKASGLEEHVRRFSSLNELFAFCLSLPHPGDIDHIILDGFDANGRPRQLSFIYSSISESLPTL